MKDLIPAIEASDSANSQSDRHSSGQHLGWASNRGAGHQWQRGERMGYNDWDGAQPIDYRRHHLCQPPRGHQWRESNGRYVMAAVATGLIASIMLNDHR